MAHPYATAPSSSTPILPGLSPITPPQAPQQEPKKEPVSTLEEYSHIASQPELASLNAPHLTPQHFETDSTSLAAYAATTWNNNRYMVISAEAIIGRWVSSIKENVKDRALQQKWFDQIHSPEFHRVWEVRFQVLRDPVPIEFALYRPSHLPFSGKSHNTIQMFSASGPMVVVPYYGHTSLQNLDYFHLLKALPTLNPQLPASYFEEKEFVYNIFAGIVRNIFYFETEENKRRVLSQIQTDTVKAHWLGASFRKKLIGHTAAQAKFKTLALDRIPVQTDWKLKDGTRHRRRRNRKLRPGLEKRRREVAGKGEEDIGDVVRDTQGDHGELAEEGLGWGDIEVDDKTLGKVWEAEGGNGGVAIGARPSEQERGKTNLMRRVQQLRTEG